MSIRPPAWLLTALVATGGLACGEIAGLDTFIRGQGQGGQSTGSTTSSGTSGGGGASSSSGLNGGGGTYVSECPPGTVEAPDVPGGWQGHFKIVQNSSEAALATCDSPAGVTVHGDLTTSPATCPCTCGPPQKSACTAAHTRYAPADVGCAGTPVTTATLSYGCNSLTVSSVQRPFRHQPNPAPPGMCSPSALPPTIDPATWGNHLRACQAPVQQVDDLGCTEAPLPPFEDRLCVLRTGEHPCPTEFPFGDALFGNYDDTRGCADDCGCGSGGVTCGGVLRVYGAAAACTFQNPGTYQPGCTGTYIGAEPEAFYDATTTGTCAPATATPTGEAVGAEPQTVCCAQP